VVGKLAPFPRAASAKQLALVASLTLHALFVLWFSGHGPLNVGGAAESFAPSPEPLLVRLVTPPVPAPALEPASEILEVPDSTPATKQAPQPEPTAASKSLPAPAAPSELPTSSQGAFERMGTIIDLSSGGELAASYWMGAKLVSPRLTLALTVNPGGFIDAWEITPAFDLTQLPAGSIDHLIRRIPVTRTGETHIVVYEFVLGIREEKTIANLYSPSR